MMLEVQFQLQYCTTRVCNICLVMPQHIDRKNARHCLIPTLNTSHCNGHA